MEEFDLEAAVDGYAPLDHPAFVESLRALEFTNPKWLYRGIGDTSPWQGDVIEHAELSFLDEDGAAVIWGGPAMLLSHGCDAVMERDVVAALAPVAEVAQFEERQPEPERASRVDALRKNRIASLFYLPAVGNRPERYVDFAWTSPVSVPRIHRFFAAAIPDGCLRLSAAGWYLLTGKLAYYVARYEKPEDYPRD